MTLVRRCLLLELWFVVASDRKYAEDLACQEAMEARMAIVVGPVGIPRRVAFDSERLPVGRVVGFGK